MPIVKAMSDLPPGQGYELDPTRANSQDLEQNQLNVQFLTSKFLDLIYASRTGLPPYVNSDSIQASISCLLECFGKYALI